MGIFRELFNGLGSATAGAGNGRARGGRIVRLCQELDWEVDEIDDDGDITLYFKGDGLCQRREVLIWNGDGLLVTFLVLSLATYPVADMPDGLACWLMERNWVVGLGAWQAFVSKEGDVIFAHRYTVPTEGLDAGTLKFICKKLREEVSACDAELHRRGVLRG